MEPEKNLEKLSTIVNIVVVGDIGHSPRMCNHAFSFATQGRSVNIFGYLDSMPHDSVNLHKNIRIHPVKQPPKFLSTRLPILSILMLALKCMWIFFSLAISLIPVYYGSSRNNKNILILQNPPGLPTMLVCYMIARINKMVYIIDWHNYTFSMFGNKISKLLELYEGFMGRLADLNICVSKAMQCDLHHRWRINATVLYDRPPSWIFRKLEKKEQNQFRDKFISTLPVSKILEDSEIFHATDKQEVHFMSKSSDGTLKMNGKRPLLLVSSTSWTPDEDFSLLLDALQYYDGYRNAHREIKLPKILVVITGKGPEKKMYLERISSIVWKNVLILTAWLEAEDYPKLLACADVGVCLHTSTSGLDLPMKIVDMFGCQLPVLAKRFPAIEELVDDGINGLLFGTSQELNKHLIRVAENFPNNEVLKGLHNNLSSGFPPWEENWKAVMEPLFNESEE